MKVLIVDDSAVIRQVLIRILEPYALTCVEASNGVEAVSQFGDALKGNTAFDLVLMDIEMPVMNGQQALKEIRLIEKKEYGISLYNRDYTHIIVLTSLDDPENFLEAYTKGRCNGYLTKPVVANDLLEKLRDYGLIQKEEV